MVQSQFVKVNRVSDSKIGSQIGSTKVSIATTAKRPAATDDEMAPERSAQKSTTKSQPQEQHGAKQTGKGLAAAVIYIIQ